MVRRATKEKETHDRVVKNKENIMERLKQLIEAPERKNKENETEAIFAEIMPEPFLDPHVQEVSKIPSRIKVQVVVSWV